MRPRVNYPSADMMNMYPFERRRRDGGVAYACIYVYIYIHICRVYTLEYRCIYCCSARLVRTGNFSELLGNSWGCYTIMMMIGNIVYLPKANNIYSRRELRIYMV